MTSCKNQPSFFISSFSFFFSFFLFLLFAFSFFSFSLSDPPLISLAMALIVPLLFLLWYWITHEGWYAIKQRSQPFPSFFFFFHFPPFFLLLLPSFSFSFFLSLITIFPFFSLFSFLFTSFFFFLFLSPPFSFLFLSSSSCLSLSSSSCLSLSFLFLSWCFYIKKKILLIFYLMSSFHDLFECITSITPY